MGDIIYTSPVIRCLKLQLPHAEIHFLTKPDFKFLLDQNPYLDKLHLLKPNLKDTIANLRTEGYDYIIDLHDSLRSTLVKIKLGVKSSTYKKERFKKWLAIKFKINLVNPKHLVERYLDTVLFLGVVNDQKPIDYFLNDENFDLQKILNINKEDEYVAFVIGANHFTKRLPNYKIIELCRTINYPIILLGGKDVEQNGAYIKNALPDKVYNYCGNLSLNESVYIVKNAKAIIGFDTGLTHIAEAFNKKLATIWGSTLPQLLGVHPYKVKKHYEAEVTVSCRPCSKFGLAKCPKGHFKCMNDMNLTPIENFINNE